MNKNKIEIEKALEPIRSRLSSEKIAFHNISSSYIQITIRSAIILNGGALVGLPTFFTVIYNRDIPDHIINLVVSNSVIFVFSIILAVVSSFTSYFNIHKIIELLDYRQDHDMYNIKLLYNDVTDKEYADIKSKHERALKYTDKIAKWTYYFVLLFIILSYSVFFVGCYRIVATVSEEEFVSMLDWINIFCF